MITSVEMIYTPDGTPNGTHVVSYKVTKSDNIIYSVPKDTGNRDYQEILDWVAAGNSIVDPNAD